MTERLETKYVITRTKWSEHALTKVGKKGRQVGRTDKLAELFTCSKNYIYTHIVN